MYTYIQTNLRIKTYGTYKLVVIGSVLNLLVGKCSNMPGPSITAIWRGGGEEKLKF